LLIAAGRGGERHAADYIARVAPLEWERRVATFLRAALLD
jgi:hypothetical protein